MATEYTFTIRVKEKYCYGARLDETLVKETEKEKPYANDELYLVKRGSTDTLNYPTTLSGQFTRKFTPGTYMVFFPEKFRKGPMDYSSKCKEWRVKPDTVIVLDPSYPNVNLNLYRPCSPCNPIRQ